MKRSVQRTWRINLLTAFIALSVCSTNIASAKTDVSVEGDTIVIQVPIDVRGLHGGRRIKDAQTGQTFDAITYIEREVERIWNEAFQGFTYECWKFRLDLKLYALDYDAKLTDGHHVVRIDQKEAHSSWDSTGPDDLDPTLDFPFAYSRDMTGVFNTPEPTVLAHEIGHAMGLGDDYLGKKIFKPEAGGIGERAGGVYFVDKEGDVVQPGSFTTHGVGRPEPIHLWRVINMMKQAGVLPPCVIAGAYLWEGRIEVGNTFDGRTLSMDVHGRHNWQGSYVVKFLEKATTKSVSNLSGRSVSVNEIIPLELHYTIKADHHHDFDHRWGDVVMNGAATGKLTGSDLTQALLGHVLRIEAGPVHSSLVTPPGAFGSWKEFQQFVAQFTTENRPGCYWFAIKFRGTPAQRRQLYQGINRTGSSPIHPDPDQDFIRVMPAFMPDGANLYGCLDTHDQKEVRGEHSFPYADPGPLDSTASITIKWSFLRCGGESSCVLPSRPTSSRPSSGNP